MLVPHDLEIFTSVHQSSDYGLDETIVTTHHQVVENQNKGYLTLRNIQCATMKITDLSDEILLKILEYLSTHDIIRIVALVSKKFNHVSKEFKLIKHIAYIVCLDDISSQLNYLEFCGFLGKSKNLRSLELEVYSAGFDFGCNLNNVTISGTTLGRYNHYVVKTLAYNCPKLYKFQFTSSDDIGKKNHA